MWAVARRPRWIGALILALAIAAGFAALGQWQLARSIESAAPPAVETEVVVDLDSVVQPQQPVREDATGQLVRFEAEWVPADYTVLSGRINVDGPGFWVVGHAVAADGASVAVALGWTESADAAASTITQLQAAPPAPQVTGRFLPTESPQEDDFEVGEHSVLAVPELINTWSQAPDGVYGGYVIADEAPAGLELIDAPPPSTEVSLNLLNIFYAVEWVIFAGFAIFLWYRLVRDAWEEEQSSEEAPSPPVE